MEKAIHKIKELSTTYFFTIIIITILYAYFVDCKSLRKKKLKREEKICKGIAYGYLIIGVALFIVTRFVL